MGFELPSQVCLDSELIRTRNIEFNQKMFVSFTLLISQMMGFLKICFYAMQDNCVFDSLVVVVLLLPGNTENHILCCYITRCFIKYAISQCNSIKEFLFLSPFRKYRVLLDWQYHLGNKGQWYIVLCGFGRSSWGPFMLITSNFHSLVEFIFISNDDG